MGVIIHKKTGSPLTKYPSIKRGIKIRNNMLLAIGTSTNQEFSAYLEMKAYLASYGIELVLFQQDKCLEGEFLNYSVSNSSSDYTFNINGKVYNMRDFKGVVYFHPNIPRSLLEYKPNEYAVYISKQYYDMRRALWYLMSDKIWLNNPWDELKAENKIFQLKVARELGLLVPDTLITSNPELIRKFYFKHGSNIIVKSLAVSPIMDYCSFTRKITVEDIEDTSSLVICPAIFQQNIPKEYELRITIVNGEVFTTKIFSQEDIATSQDWRVKPKLNDFDVRMEEGFLDPFIEKKLLSLVSMLGLKYGAIDMIMTTEGEYIFLEINPCGQWFFVQQKTNSQIGKAIADYFIKSYMEGV